MKIECLFVWGSSGMGHDEIGFTIAQGRQGGIQTDIEVKEEINNVKEELSKIEKKFDGELEFGGWDIVHNEDELLKKSIKLQSSDVDAVLIYIFRFISFSLAPLTFNKPLIFFSKQYKKPFYCDYSATCIDWPLKKINKGHWATIVRDSYDQLLEKIKVLHVISKLKHTKLLCIGPPNMPNVPPSIAGFSIYESIRIAQEKMGITIEFVTLKEFIEEFKKMGITNEIRGVYDDFLGKAKEKNMEIKEKSALEAVKIYFLLKKMIKNTNANAITINCYATNLIDEINTTPCYALSKLNDEGIVAACEGDLCNLIAMLMASYIADKPVFFCDSEYNPKVGTIISCHCACPTKLSGYNKEIEPYIATTHYESGKGLTPQVIMKKGQEVTIITLPYDLNSTIIAKGVIKDSNMGFPICRTQVEIEMNNPEEFYNRSSQLGCFRHMAVVYGDHTRELKEMCHLLEM